MGASADRRMDIVEGDVNKRTIAAIEKRIRREERIVSASRDRIRDLLQTLEEYDSAWDDARNALEEAADRVSELL